MENTEITDSRDDNFRKSGTLGAGDIFLERTGTHPVNQTFKL